MSYINSNQKEKGKGKSLISEFNKIDKMISVLMKKSKTDKYQNIKYDVYLIKSDWIDKWEKPLSGNKKNKIEKIKLINSFEQLKNAIFTNEKFYIILDKYINIFINEYKNFQNGKSFKSYIGNQKIIIYFDQNSILIIAKSNKLNAKKYFRTKIYLNSYESGKEDFIIKNIININIDIFFKKSQFNELGLEFIELNSLKNESQNNPSENLNKKNELTIQYLKVKTVNSNNLENKNKNNINPIINNKPVNKSIQDSLPNNSIQIIQNNQESQLILNNPKNTNIEIIHENYQTKKFRKPINI